MADDDGIVMTDRTGTRATEDSSARDDEPGGLLPQSLQKRRDALARRPALNLAYRVVVGVVGTAVLVVGFVLIPYPGPGWVIVFAGLGILATEFSWAHRLLRFARARYDAFTEWLKRQHWSVQLAFGVLTFAVVVVTLWLLNALHTVGGWVGIHWAWLQSPIFGS